MSYARRVILRPTHSCKLAHEARHVTSTANRSHILIAADSGRFTLLDARLRMIDTGKLPVKPSSIALHPQGKVVAVDGAKELVVGPLTGGKPWFRHKYRGWSSWEGGAVAFAGEDRLVWIDLLEAGCEEANAVLLDTAGNVLATQTFVALAGSGFFFRHTRDAHRFLVWSGAGQDGQENRWLTVHKDAVEVQALDALGDHAPPSLSADGMTLAVANDAGELACFSLPSMKKSATINTDGRDDEFMPGSICLVGERSHRAIVVNENNCRLHLVDFQKGAFVDVLDIAGHEVEDGDDPEAVADLWFMHELPNHAMLTIHGGAGEKATVHLHDTRAL